MRRRNKRKPMRICEVCGQPATQKVKGMDLCDKHAKETLQSHDGYSDRQRWQILEYERGAHRPPR